MENRARSCFLQGRQLRALGETRPSRPARGAASALLPLGISKIPSAGMGFNSPHHTLRAVRSSGSRALHQDFQAASDYTSRSMLWTPSVSNHVIRTDARACMRAAMQSA